MTVTFVQLQCIKMKKIANISKQRNYEGTELLGGKL